MSSIRPPLRPDIFDQLSPETQATILARRELEDRHEAELAQVRSWRWERMVQRAGYTRRVRQSVTVRLHPVRWPHGMGSDDQPPCHTIMASDGYPHPAGVHWREQWDKDHEWEPWRPNQAARGGVPVIWRVDLDDRYGLAAHYYCDRCLPAEFRPAPGAPHTTGGSGWQFRIAGAWRVS